MYGGVTSEGGGRAGSSSGSLCTSPPRLATSAPLRTRRTVHCGSLQKRCRGEQVGTTLQTMRCWHWYPHAQTPPPPPHSQPRELTGVVRALVAAAAAVPRVPVHHGALAGATVGAVAGAAVAATAAAAAIADAATVAAVKACVAGVGGGGAGEGGGRRPRNYLLLLLGEPFSDRLVNLQAVLQVVAGPAHHTVPIALLATHCSPKQLTPRSLTVLAAVAACATVLVILTRGRAVTTAVALALRALVLVVPDAAAVAAGEACSANGERQRMSVCVCGSRAQTNQHRPQRQSHRSGSGGRTPRSFGCPGC